MGFYFDSHAHPLWAAALELQISLRDCDFAAFIGKLGRLPSDVDTPHLAYGWNETSMNKTLAELEDAFVSEIPPEVPLIAMRVCSHKALATESFKKRFNIRSEGPALFEDEIRGLQHLWRASDRSFQIFPKLKAQGLAAVADLCVSAFEVELYKKHYQLEKLQTQLFLKVQESNQVKEPFEYVNKDSSLQLRYIKFFLDGTFGAQTAWLSKPYSDNLHSMGSSLWNFDKLKAEVEYTLEKNFLLAFHVIGDAAIDQALHLGEVFAKEMQAVINKQAKLFQKPAYHRLEHLQLCRDDQIEKIKKQNLWSLGLQPSHRVCDEGFSLLRLGQERLIKEAYRLKSFLDADLRVSLGSDGPIAPFDPKANLSAATEDTRSNERISRADCEALMTQDGRDNAGLPDLR